MEQLAIIKIGGQVIDQPEALALFLKDFANISGKKILVHGGGKLATTVAEAMGISQQMIDGRRVTDAETLKVVTMVYAGYINKNLVAALQGNGCNAIGLTGADANAILAEKRVHPSVDFGFVGDIRSVNVDFFQSLLQAGLSIVMAPITHDQQGQLLNTNADTIAQELAKALSSQYEVDLIYCFEKAGVLRDVQDINSLIPTINPAGFEILKAQQIISAGMLPKLENAFAAVHAGVKKVTIGNYAELQLLVQQRAGTTITHE